MKSKILMTVLVFLMLSYKTSYAAPLPVNAVSAIAVDCKSKVILFEKNPHIPIPMASTTKIVTALIALNYGNLDNKFAVSKNASGIKGSKVGYRPSEEITVKELTYGLMMRSGNDAAIALAEGISGSVENFSKVMNEYAKEMGLLNTSFETPHGLDKDNHFSSAYDLALATIKAKENSEFNKIVSSKDIKKEEMGFTRDYHNINKILWRSEEADGVKTGYTGKAGKCLVSSFKKDEREIIIVLLNSSNRFDETMKVYKYVNNEYEYKKLYSMDDIVHEVKWGSKVYCLGFKRDIILPVRKGSNIEVKFTVNNIPKKIEKDAYIGKAEFISNNSVIYWEPLKFIEYK
ncbi:D-alanyl-D-alanine carboxypeptidase family protein [Clostridium polynesiense]|uniref:D-alanyl-D-alanine carboxypeptidase family protein n=1 Tax=Clostridium polynesiense TaxID=1325933 RepID=UPI00058C1182|nr:D-alanyl-D-alanine carboxypeptidase family protein [Clostridium polynesiense]